MIHWLIGQNVQHVAVRFSEYEAIETVMALKGLVKWVWVDCFTRLNINKNTYQQLKQAGFKLCLVSPELQGRPQDIKVYKEFLKKETISFDAVCTKIENIPLWRE